MSLFQGRPVVRVQPARYAANGTEPDQYGFATVGGHPVFFPGFDGNQGGGPKPPKPPRAPTLKPNLPPAPPKPPTAPVQKHVVKPIVSTGRPVPPPGKQAAGPVSPRAARAIQTLRDLHGQPASQANTLEAWNQLSHLSDQQIHGLAKELGVRIKGNTTQELAGQLSDQIGQSPQETAPAVAPSPQGGETPKPSPLKEKAQAEYHASIDKSHLSDQAKATYKQSLSRALRDMPEKAIARMQQGMPKGIMWEENVEGVRRMFKNLTGEEGIPDAFYAGGYGAVLDGNGSYMGGYTQEGGGNTAAHGIYAHELVHAMDYNGSEKPISGSDDWLDAFHTELASGDLTNYAATEPVEGFAEFGRLLFGSNVDKKAAEQKFPKCFAVFRKHGLWEGKEQQGALQPAPPQRSEPAKVKPAGVKTAPFDPATGGWGRP